MKRHAEWVENGETKRATTFQTPASATPSQTQTRAYFDWLLITEEKIRQAVKTDDSGNPGIARFSLLIPLAPLLPKNGGEGGNQGGVLRRAAQPPKGAVYRKMFLWQYENQ